MVTTVDPLTIFLALTPILFDVLDMFQCLEQQRLPHYTAWPHQQVYQGSW